MPSPFFQRMLSLLRLPTKSRTSKKKRKPTPDELAAIRKDTLKLVAPLFRPTFIPRVQKGIEGPFTGSRFCGHAALKPGEPWPACKCGEPLQLFLQLNSATLPAAAGRPFGDGILQFFYCTGDNCSDTRDQPFDPAHLIRILPSSSDLKPTPRPETRKNPTFPPAAIIGWETRTNDLPDYVELSDLGYDLTDEQVSALYEAASESCTQQGDKLLGWPYWIQGVEYPHCPRCNTRMQFIFQIDSEKNVPYMFGDVGAGHITICPQHRDVLAFGWACF